MKVLVLGLIFQTSKMKTLALVACFLTIVYATDPQQIEQTYNNYVKCTKELNAKDWTLEVIECTMKKNNVIDEQGLINKEKLFAVYDILISDPAKLKEAKDISSACFQQVQSGSNDEKTMALIQCGYDKNIAKLFDKLE